MSFDYDKISGKKILVKTLAEGTKFHALNDTDYALSDKDLMICDSHSQPMCIGGVFGGINSGVTNDTVNIFLETHDDVNDANASIRIVFLNILFGFINDDFNF